MSAHKKINKDFFKKWTPEMSYVLGFFAADGNIVHSKRGTHYLSFYSADRDILEMIRTAMESEHKLAMRNENSGNVYRLQIGSKIMFGDLLDLGFLEKKASRMMVPDIPKMCVGHFLRGYFDGDGNVWVGYIHKERKTQTQVIQVAFTSGSLIFLDGLWEVIKREGIQGGSLYTSKKRQFSRLSFSTLDALKLGEVMYNGSPKLYLKRKKLRFDQFKKEYAAVA